LRPALLVLISAAGLGLAAVPAGAATQPPVLWGCTPNSVPNPCTGSLETTVLGSTVLQKRKVLRVETPPAAPEPKVDCFYVYPTISSSTKPTAPLSLNREVKSILAYQASRFQQNCRIFAPVYRQLTFAGFLTTDETQAQKNAAQAYGDVLAAWKQYLANDNHGRGVIFIGHSQGAGVLTRLLAQEIDPSPELRKQLVSALIIGGNLVVPKGQVVGGDFQNIPLCTSATETGCTIAYSLYGTRPKQSTLFGRIGAGPLRNGSGNTPDPATDEIACVNPAELSGDDGAFQTYTRSQAFPGLIGIGLQLLYFGLPPKASTPWIEPGEKYAGKCVTSNNAHVLYVRPANAATIVPIASPTPDWGLHLADMNLPMGNLIKLVQSEAGAYTAAHPETAPS
jgi:hypothetical protein